MNKLSKISALILTILTIGDIILKNMKSLKYLEVLTKPLFSVNFLEILILILVIFLGYNFLPKHYKKIITKKRAEKFYKNWIKFKKILQDHYNGKCGDSEKYPEIRAELEKDFNYFLPEIQKIQENSHREHNKLVISNFEHCFRPRNIAEWKQIVHREIPRELDCFDYIIVGLMEEI